MDHTSRLSKQYLDTLSTDELLNLADTLALDIPSDLDRIFIIEELLELEEEFSGGDEDTLPALEEVTALAPVLLPRQYNITFIKVILRDPAWAFVYWEIKGHDRELFEKSPDFGGYCLRVTPALQDQKRAAPAENGAGFLRPETIFVIPVNPGDSAWYLSIPPDEGWYMVDISVQKSDESRILASSRPFRVPPLRNPFSGENRTNGVSSLLELSGLEDSHIIYNMDRTLRVHKPRAV